MSEQEAVVVTMMNHGGPCLFRWDNALGGNGSHQGQARQPQRRTSVKDNDEEIVVVEDKENTDHTAAAKQEHHDDTTTMTLPSFLARESVGPHRPPPFCRRPPTRSKGFHAATMDLHQIPVKPIEFLRHRGPPTPTRMVQEGMARVLQDIVVQQQQHPTDSDKVNTVTVLFAIRVPGCGQCREHGLQLADLAHQRPDVSVMGVIKETGIDDDALMEFYTDYFPFPLYKDSGMQLYNIIANDKMDTFTLLSRGQDMHQRVDAKGIRTAKQVKGEGLTQGGVLIFDKTGKLQYVYYETFGHELDMQAIHWAIDQVSQQS